MKTFKFKFNIFLLSIMSVIIFVIMLIGINRIFILKPAFCGLMILWLILHELLHYIGFLINKKVTTNDLVLGIKLERGIMYCMCKKCISKKSILVSLLMPFILIGVLTLIIGLVINSNTLIFLSVINVSSSIGDIVMAIFILSLPNDILYFDLEDEGAFYIKSKHDLLKYSNILIKQEKVIKCPENNKRIRISLISYIVILLILILCFI